MKGCPRCENVKVGDNGQRYVVVGTCVETGKDEIMGYTSNPTGGGLLLAAQKWPRYKSARVVDRNPTPEQAEAAKLAQELLGKDHTPPEDEA